MTVHAITATSSRYRIEATALTATHVVASLGGLLFDRRILGWDTLVLLDDCADIRPLQIIGADCADLRLTLDMREHSRAAAIATSMQLYRSDPRVCARIDAAIDGGVSEVVVWGDTDSIGRKPELIVAMHHVSQVAAAFKNTESPLHALRSQAISWSKNSWQPAQCGGRPRRISSRR